jgi:cellulose synthase operon protein C
MRQKKKKLTTDKHSLTLINSNRIDGIGRMKSISYPRLSAQICGFIFLCFAGCVYWFGFSSPQKISAEESNNEIENALFTRQEFFGAEAIVPLPTAEARENLARLAESAPDNPQILEKLAALDEKLARFDEAEKSLNRLAEIDAARREDLAAFYHRRARFEAEAEVLNKILFSIEAEKRAAVFERLIDLARIHDLPAYLNREFYTRVARENPDAFEVFQKLTEKLAEEKNYAEALRFLRDAKQQFPDRQSVLLDREIEILLEMNQPREAEKAYQAAFNPFWSEEEAGKFYEFLSEQDRLRTYGSEVKARFKKNPADFDAAIRLALYQNHDYESGNDTVAPVILKLEKAKKNWTTGELVTVTRLLLQAGEPEAASRFLYTLYLREDFQKNDAQRARVLYQLFEMFSDAEKQHLPLTKGDLRFYEDVARADTNPGMATGILSLIFSDTNVRERLSEQEIEADKYFNRAAAYRIFEEYKKEFPTSPELAQMYLDIVRLYTATKETEIAEKTLEEFAGRFQNASDYPAVALKLADALTATNQTEKERQVYQNVLDYLGKNRKPEQKVFVVSSDFKPFEIKPFGIAPDRSEGINIPNPEATPKPDDYYDDEPENNFHDYLARPTSEITYAEVLEKLVASLANEKKTSEILALYSDEIAKYPDEEWLYERRLAWLEQTNLLDEQLKVYQSALARFQSRGWQDKLARWFLRQNRKNDFAEFSQELIEKLNDEEAQNYLSQFVDVKTAPDEFEKQMYLKLYRTAHERFPHNIAFANGLLRFYKANKMAGEWRRLSAEYFFAAPEIRESFLSDLAEKGELRNYLEKARDGETIIYELFRADASVRLSNYENAVKAYRKLNRIYPNTPEFSGRLVAFTRSFGQKNRELLTEASDVSKARADFLPSSAEYRTTSGEIFAEMGNYEKSREEWEKLIATARGEKEIYLDAATVYWDYFQYDDALRTIKILREKFADDALYAFEAGAIFEAKHETARAIGEYVKALAAKDDEDTQKEKAKNRLAFLAASEESAANKNEIARTIEAEFQIRSRKAKDAAYLSLGYAELLGKIEQPAKAETVLNRAVLQSRDTDFLEAAKDFYSSEAIKAGEQLVLKRLAERSESPRRTISYYLQLAQSFEENGERDSAKAILSQTVARFPLNYGVVTEASDFYRRLGFENESIEVLQNALPKSRGEYRTDIAQKLAKRLVSLNRLEAAGQILSSLHAKDRAETSIFRELASVYVRTGKPELMRQAFDETVAALKQTDKEKREIDDEIADLRTSMIDAFTRLKDYESAIAQHIEIINREPENEELTENAIRYAQRYGGGTRLLNYYLKLSGEAFKNYRWQVVLARIYEASGGAENAAKNYRGAIVNQPEMTELYVALADLETKRNNFDEAVKNLDTVLELTNDEAVYVKKKIEVLKKAGRLQEAQAEQAKLPVEPEKKSVAVDRFAEAQKLRDTEREKARQLYREAFEKLVENPLVGELKAADIAGYVQSAREEESLAVINERLWTLREKLTAATDEKGSTAAGEARRRISILEGAMTESIGSIAKTVATDEELVALHESLNQKIEKISYAFDKHGTISLVQNISRRAGFGDLEEKILWRKLDEAKIDRHIDLQNILSFYNERGAYQKAFDVLEKTGSDNLPLKAETARLANQPEKELEALRAIYQKPSEITAQVDANVARYLEILYAENRAELKSLTEKSSVFQLQLINFLLGKGEAALAHAAIENAALPPVWKVARHAEVSLALREFDEDAECYFCEALQLDTIGEMVRQAPDKKRFLIGDQWFRLTREYGEWLKEKAKSDERLSLESKKYLAAMIENLSRNADEQAKLGEFYLQRNAYDEAIEHFRLALESDEKIATWAKLGAAYYAAGKTDLATDAWKTALAEADVESSLIYFQILRKYGLAEKARENLAPVIVGFLVSNNADDSINFQALIRDVAASFGDAETPKAAYFRRILNERKTDTSLAEMLVNESLIGENERHEFYELLIARSEASSYYDYSFAPYLQRNWADAELIYEQENEYKTDEPENERYEWQKKYLEFLIDRRDNQRAEQTIAIIEKDLSGRYARPAWLRLAKINLQIRGGKFDLPEAEKFVGIIASESATEIKAPSVERFNDVLMVLKKENQAAQAARLSESFFARLLALEQFDAANFGGLARAFFQKGETETALRILRLMIDAASEARAEAALAETTALEIVKAKTPDAAKAPSGEASNVSNQSDALALAAEIAAEFGQADAAIEFRRALSETNPSDSNNQIGLAKLLLAGGDKNDAENILKQVTGNRDSARAARWQARMILIETGASTEIPNASFDSLSQFYNGILAVKNEQREIAAGFFINSLIADKEAATEVCRQLIEFYAASGQFFAALKLAETDKTAKPDALLQTLSEAAEKIGDYARAIEFENAKSTRSNERFEHLQKLSDEKNRRATDLTIDLENTRKL